MCIQGAFLFIHNYNSLIGSYWYHINLPAAPRLYVVFTPDKLCIEIQHSTFCPYRSRIIKDVEVNLHMKTLAFRVIILPTFLLIWITCSTIFLFILNVSKRSLAFILHLSALIFRLLRKIYCITYHLFTSFFLLYLDILLWNSNWYRTVSSTI